MTAASIMQTTVAPASLPHCHIPRNRSRVTSPHACRRSATSLAQLNSSPTVTPSSASRSRSFVRRERIRLTVRGDRSSAGMGREKPHAVVVGAGPGGALAAIALAQRGWAVDVVEAREQPDPAAQEGFRSYAMVREIIQPCRRTAGDDASLRTRCCQRLNQSLCTQPARCMSLWQLLHRLTSTHSMATLQHISDPASLSSPHAAGQQDTASNCSISSAANSRAACSLFKQIVNKRGTEALATTGLDLAPHRRVPFAGVSVQVPLPVLSK